MNAIRMAFLWGALIVGLVGGIPADGWAQVRMLRAKQVSTGQWLQRIDTGPQKAVATFQREVAEQFGLPETDVEVVETTVTPTDHRQAVAEQGTGTHAGLPVRAAPVSPGTVKDFRRAVETGMARARLNTFWRVYPTAAVALMTEDWAGFRADLDAAAADGTLTPGEANWLRTMGRAHAVPGF